MTIVDREDGAGPSAQPAGAQGHTFRIISRTLGELLVTAGVVVLLFVGYQLVWTNFQADRAAQAHTDQLREKWRASPQGDEYDLPLRDGEAFAIMHIPRLGDRYQVPVIEGVTLEDLAQGVGHYPKTALPGELGNFSVAGHRATNGEPFALLDQLRKGDRVVVETATTWYIYKVYEERIVQPTQVDVVLPVPGKPGAEPDRALLTLTTCNPRWASYERLIFHAELDAEQLKSLGRPDALDGT